MREAAVCTVTIEAPRGLRIRLDGELDSTNAVALAEQLRSAVFDSDGDVEFDIGGLSFASASSLVSIFGGLLDSLDAAGRRVTLSNARPVIVKTLDALGLLARFTVA